jgi:hypothetical protein
MEQMGGCSQLAMFDDTSGYIPIQEDGHHSIDIPIMVIDDGMGNIS